MALRVVAATGQTAQGKMTIEYFEAPNQGEVDMKRNHTTYASVHHELDSRAAALRRSGALKAGDAAGYAQGEERL